MDYQALEKYVYDGLMAKHKTDENFTFSLRQKASKGAELDYFIGTRKSNYFAFTLWTIPVYFPGSSSDIINCVIKLEKDRCFYYFDFSQTKSPSDDQNSAGLLLIKNLSSKLSEHYELNMSADANKMENFTTVGQSFDWGNLKEMMPRMISDVEKIRSIVNEELTIVKKDYPDFVGHQITLDEFNKMKEKLQRRMTNYKHVAENSKEEKNIKQELFHNQPLNQILYGPPGTGKTHNTINRAVEICNPTFNFSNQPREKVKEEYERLKDNGQIVFTTFHQSLNYEDFVEGIKPITNNEGELQYEIQPGIFKQVCNQARELNIDDVGVDWEKTNYFKMSLGGKQAPDVHDWCISNNVIALGYGDDVNLIDQGKIKTWEKYRDTFIEKYPELVEQTRFHIQATYSFFAMNKGDVVLISKGNHVIDAIGIIDGDYYWDDSCPFEYYQFRKVRWLAKDLNVHPNKFIRKNLSQAAIYGLDKGSIKLDAFKEISKRSSVNGSKQNYVVIIDEINRGNVSQIFGELITLLERDKRIGEIEQLEVSLPYSKELFGVPNNVHIIGTMNTADRSVEALDTALRRRFNFEELPPTPELITTYGMLQEVEGKLAINNSDIDLSDLLTCINDRVAVLLDRDHLIGHSYFMKVASTHDLMDVFNRNIIPLLQEYFYGDYEKIMLVLGKGFCEPKPTNRSVFLPQSNVDIDDYMQKVNYDLKRYSKGNEVEFEYAINHLLHGTGIKTED